jgi:hypothetical protein
MSNPLTTINPVCFFAAASAIANAKIYFFIEKEEVNWTLR